MNCWFVVIATWRLGVMCLYMAYVPLYEAAIHWDVYEAINVGLRGSCWFWLSTDTTLSHV